MKNDITYEYRVFTNRLIDIENMEVGKCTSKVIKELKQKDKVDGRFFHTSDTDEWFFCWNGKLQKLNLKGNSDVNAALDEVRELIKKAETSVDNVNKIAQEAKTAAADAKTAADAASAAAGKIEDKADKSDVEAVEKEVELKADKSVVDELSSKVDAIKVPSLEGYATEVFVGEKIAEKVPTKVSELENDVNYLTEHQPLDGYATEKWVGEQGYLTEIPTDYLTKEDADKLYAPFGSTGSGSVDTTEFVKEAELADKLDDMGYVKSGDLADYAKTEHTHSYNDLTDKPELFSKSYNDLTDKPDLFSKSYNDLTDTPDLFSGSYNDLTDKPTIPSIEGLATESYADSLVKDSEGKSLFDDAGAAETAAAAAETAAKAYTDSKLASIEEELERITNKILGV